MRAAIYARVSTEQQAEKYGLEAQATALRRRAQERGYALVPDGDHDAFLDDGYSGGDLDRPALSRLRQALRDGQVGLVLCYDPDRLSRNLSDLLLLADEVERRGARLEFMTQEVDGSPEGKMFFAMRGAVAEYEKAKIRERTIRGRLEKARQGKVVNPRCLPYGYIYDPDAGKVEVDQEKAQVVRLAFHLLVEEGMALSAIGRRFTQLGIPTPSGGSHWALSTLHKWLRQPAYKGDLCQLRYQSVEPGKRRNPAGHGRKTALRERPREEWQVIPVPPLVAPGMWEQAQRRLEQNRVLASRNARREYLLRGLVRCGACGRHMSGWQGHARYYRCPRHGRDRADVHGNWCSFRPVGAEELEAAVWRSVTQTLLHPENLLAELRRRREEGSPTRDVAEQKLRVARKRLEAIPKEMDRLVEGYGKGLIPDDRMGVKMEALRKEREELHRRVGELTQQLARLEVSAEQEAQALAFAEGVRAGLGNLDFAERQKLLRLLVEDVTCQEGEALVRTIIPLPPTTDGMQLYPLPREGAKG